MAATIQIIVAGILLLAWVWVLGRPLLSGGMGRGSYPSLDRSYLNQGDLGPDETFELPVAVSEVETTSDSSLFPFSVRALLPGFLRRWWRQPIARRRRQLMLATMFATFASFLLAVALRGRFIQLFALMALVLVVHALVAARIGGRIVEARRAVVVADAKRRVQPEGYGIRIRAPQVRGKPMEGVEELAALLRGDDASPASVGVTSFVSDLIDLEWGSDVEEPLEAPAATRRAPSRSSVSESTEPEAEPTVRQPAERSASESPVAEDGAPEPELASEPIFTRAVKDAKSRGRRKARPIYIESQLDEPDKLPDAKAVNHP